MSQFVFICHATEDKAVATAICEALEAGGVPCWIAPRNIKPGADYSGAIVKAIGEAKALVLVLSTHSNESEHVKREVERAVSRGVSIIPFRIEEVLPSQALEYFISTTQWVDAFTPPLEKHVDYLVANLKEQVPPEAKATKAAEPEAPHPPRAASPTTKRWFLTIPGLVTLAAAAVLVVTGLIGSLYLIGSFSRSEKIAVQDAPDTARKQSDPEKKTDTKKDTLEQVLDKEQEPNEDIRNANPISLGKPVMGRLSTEKDLDWYKFKSGPASSKVRVIVRKQFYASVDAYDQTERKITSDSAAGDDTISFAFQSQPGAYYYLLVKSDGQGPYELEVRDEDEHGGTALEKSGATGKAPLDQVLDKEQEPNEHIRDANPIPLGKPIMGRLSTKQDRDWYKFKSGPASSKVRVIVRKQFYASVVVYDRTERKITSDSAAGDDTISFAFQSQPGAYYYLLVKSDEQGPYELEVRDEDEHGGTALEKSGATGKAPLDQVLDKEQEPNEHIRDANPIPLGKPIMGRLSTKQDRDWYKFKSGPASSKVRVIVRKQFYASVVVYDRTERKITSDSAAGDDTISFAFQSQPGAYYYLLVKSDGQGPYELEVRDESE